MESSRRAPRTVIDPKVRQVGFVTPGTEPLPIAPGSAAQDVGANSPSPVMIPLAPSRLPEAEPDDEAEHRLAAVAESPPAVELSASVVTRVNTSLMDMKLDKGKEAAVEPPAQEQGGKKLKERTSRAERRELQEKQRAAKAAAKLADGLPKPEKAAKKDAEKKPADKNLEKERRKDQPRKEIPAPRMQFDDEHRVAKAKRRAVVEQTETKHRVELFRHLPQYVHASQLPSLEVRFFDENMQIHHAVYQVGLKYLTWEIVGGNARCIAMLNAFKEMISDYSVPSEKSVSRDLTAKVNSHVSFLATCRPLSISMGNAIKFLKQRIAKTPVTMAEQEAKASLISQIDSFIQEKIIFADNEMVKHAVTKIGDGDVLLTYGCTSVVEKILLHAHSIGKKFSVVIIDSRPRFEGRGLFRKLLAHGLRCTYTHLNAVSFIMQEVTKVFLGAASVFANGTVYSRVGTAAVAMVAHSYRVPVIFCCETYKFHERVQLDSICFNELGDPDSLLKAPGRKEFQELANWADNEHLQLLNLVYDATPSEYVSMIISELGMVPVTSVPVILREYRKPSYF